MWLHVNPRERLVGIAAALVMLLTAGFIGLKTTSRQSAALPPSPKPTVASKPVAEAPDLSTTVYVTGAVVSPGVQHLAADARVEQAVEAAGGFTANANKAAINLARKLVDGEQINVPSTDAATSSTPAIGTPSTSTPPVINLNTASAAELDALPGIGKVMAEKIVEFRQQHGAFTSVDQLLGIRRFGAKTLEEIRPLVRL